MRVQFVLVSLALAGALLAQRPLPPSAGRPPSPPGARPTPPPGATGHQTARERQVEAARRQEALERRGVRDRTPNSESSPPPPPPPPAPPAGPGGGPAARRIRARPVVPAVAARAERFLEARSEAARRAPVAGYRVLEVTAFRGPWIERVLIQHAWQNSGDEVQHSITVGQVVGPDVHARERLLVFESDGKPPSGWHLREGRPSLYDGAILLHPIVGVEHPMVLEDILDLSPRRDVWALHGTGEWGGRPTYEFFADTSGPHRRAETQVFSFRQFEGDWVRTEAFLPPLPGEGSPRLSRTTVLDESAAEAPTSHRRWSIRYELFPESGASLRLIVERTDIKLEADTFDPARL